MTSLVSETLLAAANANSLGFPTIKLLNVNLLSKSERYSSKDHLILILLKKYLRAYFEYYLNFSLIHHLW